MNTIDGPNGLKTWVLKFLSWSKVRAYSKDTIRTRKLNLKLFIGWADDRGIYTPIEITRAHLERYQHHVHHHRKRDDEPLTARSQNNRIGAVRAFFSWLTKQGVMGGNPAADLDLARKEHTIPRVVLTHPEMEKVLRLPDPNDVVGLRDRAMMEVLYSTAIRRAELVRLAITDIDSERRTLLIRLGKGKRDRILPISTRALRWVSTYLKRARPDLVVPPDQGVMFLSTMGVAIERNALTKLVSAYVKKAKLGKNGACHIIRHSVATIMLENGADIRHLQALLGHAQTSTTAIYAQVSMRKLREIHAKTHPASGDDGGEHQLEGDEREGGS